MFCSPFHSNAAYQLQITIMKNGGRHLEPDIRTNFPLNLLPNENLNVVVDPSQFSEGKQTGLVVEQKQPEFQTASVSGSFTDIPPSLTLQVHLEKVVKGEIKELQTFHIEKGTSFFKFLIPIEKEGFYYLSGGPWKKRLYLKPNDQLELTTDFKTGLKTTWTKSTSENQLLSQWDQLISPGKILLFDQKLDEATFTAAYKPLQPKISSFLQQAKTSNTEFNALFKTAAQLDNNLMALNMLLITQKGHYSMSLRYFWDVPAYYKQLIPQNKVRQANMLQLGKERHTLTCMLSLI